MVCLQCVVKSEQRPCATARAITGSPQQQRNQWRSSSLENPAHQPPALIAFTVTPAAQHGFVQYRRLRSNTGNAGNNDRAGCAALICIIWRSPAPVLGSGFENDYTASRTAGGKGASNTGAISLQGVNSSSTAVPSIPSRGKVLNQRVAAQSSGKSAHRRLRSG